MGAAEPEHHSGVEILLKPAERKQHLFLVPNPADVVLQAGVLSDIIEAGGHWHVNHRTSLAGIAQKGRSLKTRDFTVLAVQPGQLEVSPSTNIPAIPLQNGNTWGNLFRNWCGLSQVLSKSFLIPGPGASLFLQEEAALDFSPS